jgi:biotin transport system substrate-specific component
MISRNSASAEIKLFSRIISSELFRIISFAVLTAISAQISIPVKPVPFTLQTLLVGLSGAFLGAKKGLYSQILYLGLGAIGLPVFAPTADGFYGITSLFGPTGGYLLAFPLAAFITGYIVEKNKNYLSVVLAMILTEAIIIVSGVIFLNTFYLHNWTEAVKGGAIIFSLWTVIKVLTGAAVYTGIHKIPVKK